VIVEGLPIVRPNPLLWLRYAYIGSLPHKYDGWVLRDATCPTWILRHAARYLALVTPIVTPVLIFLPAPFSLRFMSCLVAMLTMMLFYMAFTADSIESRVQNAGFAPGTATRLREQRARH
jgi:hypothetical protein